MLQLKTQQKFNIDVYDDTSFINDLWIRVYVNNEIQKKDTDYSILQDVNNRSSINFVEKLNKNDIVLIKTRSTKAKNNNGYYEIAK